MATMTILSILGSEQASEDLSSAIQVATEVGAHLVVLAAGIAEPPTVGDYPVGIGWIERREETSRQLEAVRSRAVQQCQSSGLTHEVAIAFAEKAPLDDMLFQKALHSDLAVIGRGVSGLADLRRVVVDAVIFHAGRPLLLASDKGTVTLKPKRVLLAWDSKPGAAHAATAAMKMLVDADQVNLAIVDPEARDGEEPGADAVAYLARHGVKVVVDQLASDGRPLETVLQQHASEIQADLMVMGAYGHSRMRQWIFGGVTASVLQGAKLPVFMAH